MVFFRYFLRQAVLVNLLFLLSMAVGIFALFDLPVERYPNVSMGKVQITTVLPGASPEDVESLVTREIEESLDDLEQVEFIQSTSYRERSVVTVKFIDDTDYRSLYDELRLKVLSNMNELPSGIDPPSFTYIDVKEWLPAVVVNLVGDRSNRALSLMAEEMKLEMRRIEGVEEVEVRGEYTREFHVDLDPARMEALSVTFADVVAALQAANVSVPAGDFENEAGQYVIVVDERFRTRSDVAETVIRREADGSYTTVADVLADARMDYREPFVITSVNGRDSVQLNIQKTDGGNALDIVPAVQRVVDRFAPTLEEESVEVFLTRDQRVQVDDAISILGNNLLLGLALVFVIILIFMGLRNAVLIVIGVPFSFLVTMIFMWIGGYSLNEITLFSFVLVTGIIVDDAIVVLENIYRHLQEGKKLAEAAARGASEVAGPVLAATSTTVAAFLPMLLMTGSTGEFFSQIPIAITAAIAASLFECLIILPPHFVHWPGAAAAVREAERHSGEQQRRIIRILRSGADRIADFTARFRFSSLIIVLVLFAVAMFMLISSVTGRMNFIRIEFFPEEYYAYFVDVEGPTTASTEQTSQKLKRIAAEVMKGDKGAAWVSATASAGFYTNEDYEMVYGSNLGNVVVELPRKENWDFPDNPDNDAGKHLSHMREVLAPLETGGWQLRVRPEPGGPPAGKDVNIRVVGPNPQSVDGLAEEMNRFLREQDFSEYLLDLTDNRGQPTRVIRFRVDEKKAREYDLTATDVAGIAGSVLDGRFVGEFRSRDEDVDLRLKIAESAMRQPEDALAVPVLQHPAGPVRLGDVAAFETYEEPNKVNRYQNNRAITISANLADGAPVSTPYIVERVKERFRQIKLDYPGAELSFAGEFETTQRSYTSLFYAFIVAVLVIYLILATQFRSYIQPLIILSAVVFSLIGVIFGKFVTQGLFTVNSFIAVVGVTGVVVNDSLVLIDFINRGYREGMSRAEAVRHGIRVRLRPILLTTLTTTLGLLPMALGIPSYSTVWGTMASTFVTGLCTATFLTLFIVPVEWDLLMGLNERMQARRKKKEQTS